MNTFNVKNYTSIQACVDACHKNGGGSVIIPAGKWYSGPIHLKSNINLHLEDNSLIIFSDKYDDYLPVVFTRWEGCECYNYSPLIYANGCCNVSITGNGTLFGNGQAWWHWKKLQQPAAEELAAAQYNNIPVEKRIYGTEKAALRPSFIQTINCTDVLFKDFTVKDGPQWTIHPVYCKNVTIQNVTVDTNGHNTDGLNPDSCKNVLIENCSFKTGDDCIAVNAGLNEDGWRVGRVCENIEIRNCTFHAGHGGIVIGSAVSGGVKNVYAHDCKIDGIMQGLRIKSMRGRGGFVKNVRFENIEINNVTEQAVQINMFYEFSTVIPKSDTPSDFDDIQIRNITGSNAKIGIQIRGLSEHKPKNIILENISLTAQTAFECSDTENITISKLNITSI